MYINMYINIKVLSIAFAFLVILSITPISISLGILHTVNYARYYIIKLKTYNTVYEYIKAFNTVYSALSGYTELLNITPNDLEEYNDRGLTANIPGYENTSEKVVLAPGQVYDPVSHKIIIKGYRYVSSDFNISYNIVYNVITVTIQRKTPGENNGTVDRDTLVNKARKLLEHLDMSPDNLDVEYVTAKFYATGIEGPNGFTPSRYYVEFYIYINGVPLIWRPHVVFDVNGDIIRVWYLLLDVEEVTEVDIYSITEITSFIKDNSSEIEGPYYWFANTKIDDFPYTEHPPVILPVYHYRRTDGADCLYSAVKGSPKLLVEAYYATAGGGGAPEFPPLTPPYNNTSAPVEDSSIGLNTSTSSSNNDHNGDNMLLAQDILYISIVAIILAIASILFIVKRKR